MLTVDMRLREGQEVLLDDIIFDKLPGEFAVRFLGRMGTVVGGCTGGNRDSTREIICVDVARVSSLTLNGMYHGTPVTILPKLILQADPRMIDSL